MFHPHVHETISLNKDSDEENKRGQTERRVGPSVHTCVTCLHEHVTLLAHPALTYNVSTRRIALSVETTYTHVYERGINVWGLIETFWEVTLSIWLLLLYFRT